MIGLLRATGYTGRLTAAALAAGTTRWRPERVTLPFATGPTPGVVIPWGEQLTVPSRHPRARVRTAIAMRSSAARSIGTVGGLIARSRPLLRAARPLLRRAVDRLPEGPDEQRRAAARFTLVAEATSATGRSARVQVRGHDAYQLTAHLLVACATRLDNAPPGPLTPAQAFPAGELLTSCGLEWQHLD